jgi:peptidylamidoglycolate lyase
MHHATCQGVGKILFAWAKDAPPTILPDDVGFKIGESSKEHLVLQVGNSAPKFTYFA